MVSYKIIACDLDDTLADTKQHINDKMADILLRLLKHYQLCVITGGSYRQLQTNVIARLDLQPEALARIHLMSTSGARYDRFDGSTHKWVMQYEKTMPLSQRKHIATTIETTAKNYGFWESSASSEISEDRRTQVTFSALGQNAPLDKKRAWDPTTEKRRRLQAALGDALPEYEVVINGTTSIDVLQKGIDKAFGIRELMMATKTTPQDILFFGDSLYESGNDYPVKQAGIASVAVTRWQDTARYIEDNMLQ